MWCCKDIDISWTDWLRALIACVRERDRSGVSASPPGNLPAQSVLCLSARSGLDLLLRVRRWKPGDEVLCSALTVPDMARILRSHGLVPVPIDLDPRSGCWRREEIENAIGPRTRAMLLAHLFGSYFDLGPELQVARAHGIEIIEDCAQAWRGPHWWGHPGASASLFSYGPTKTNTALGGGLVRFRDSFLFDAAYSLHRTYPAQNSIDYLRRVLSYGAMKAGSSRWPYALGTQFARLLGADHEALIHGLTRSIPAENLLSAIRQQPSSPLATVLSRRIGTSGSLSARTAAGQFLLSALSEEVPVVGRGDSSNSSFWVVPVLPKDPAHFKSALRKAGFDAMSGRLQTISGDLASLKGSLQLENAVYLPFSPAMPRSELLRLGHAVSTYFASAGSPVHW